LLPPQLNAREIRLDGVFTRDNLLDEVRITNPAPNREEIGVWAKTIFETREMENAWCPLFEFCGHQAFF
jgi:hypothetical protein